MEINIIGMGGDCTAASAIEHLGYRIASYPFDWIQLHVSMIELCFKEGFARFHRDLKYASDMDSALTDAYGFRFFHDYPIVLRYDPKANREHHCIVENWRDYYDENIEKYGRRIRRFLELMKDEKPLLVLCRHWNTVDDVLKLQELFKVYYNKENVYFINASPIAFENDKIKNITPEMNGTWNDKNIWKLHVDEFLAKHNMIISTEK